MNSTEFQDLRSTHKNQLCSLAMNNLETIPFIIASKRLKYLGMNITKEHDLYTENYVTLLKDIKDLNK